MATYKQPCVHCGELVDRSARACPRCASLAPFGYHCPSCAAPIAKGYAACGGCGRSLGVACPACQQMTFAGERCDWCGASLLVRCPNARCGQPQFFENTACTACGKKIKPAKGRK